MSPEDFLQAVRAWHTTYRRVASALAPFDVTPLEFALLTAIEKHPMISLSDLSDTLHSTLPKISMDTDRLVRKRLVKRQSMRRDRRARSVALTMGGTRLLDKMRQTAEIIEDHYGHDIDTSSTPLWCDDCDCSVIIRNED